MCSDPKPEEGVHSEATGVHHVPWRRGGYLAGRCAGAAARTDAAHRSAPWGHGRGHPEAQIHSKRSHKSYSNQAGPMAATYRSITAGARATPPPFANTRRNWPRSRRTSFGLWHFGLGGVVAGDAHVPVVFVNVADPVGAGFVDSLARPAATSPALLQFEYSLSAKWPELLKQIEPGVTRAAVLRDPALTVGDRPIRRHPVGGAVARGGGKRGQRARPRRDRARRHCIRAVPNGGLVVTSSALTLAHRDLIFALAARHKLPAVYYRRFSSLQAA